MIKYVTGNLLDAPQTVIAHGCNAQGVMGSGVAKAIRDKWPNVYETYTLKHKTFGLRLGDIIPVVTIDGKMVINCITQDKFGKDGKQYADYDAIASCFEKINERIHNWDSTEVAIPRLGAGLGGGDWNIIEDIIIRKSKNFIPVVYDLK